MASKRALYKPVVTEKVNKKNRRPLAQGRLVNTTGKPLPEEKLANVENANEEKKVATPRARLQSRILNQGTQDVDRLTPRRGIPHRLEQKSPAVVRQDTLDVSDSDMDSQMDSESLSKHQLLQFLSDFHETLWACLLPSQDAHLPFGFLQVGSGYKEIRGAENVLVVDALRQSFDPNRSEVDIVMGYTRSPAKIFCHSPASKLNSSSRSRRVLIDEVPSVSILTESNTPPIDSLQENSPPAFHKQEPEGKFVMPLTVASPAKRPLPDIPASPSHYPQPNFDDSLKSISPNQGSGKMDQADHSDDQMSVISNISTTSSLREVLGNSLKNSSRQNDGSRKKKAHVISSRYMQSAHKFKMNSSSNRSKLNKTTPLKTTKAADNVKGSSKSKQKGILKSTNGQMSMSVQQTPMVNQQKGGTTGKTSTPTHEDVTFIHNIDTSAIAPANMSTLATSMISSGEMSYSAAPKKSEENKLSQLDLDILYCEYLQWLYLDVSARKSFHEQEKSAMSQIHSLWNEVEKSRQKDMDIRSELHQIKHANDLDKQLDLQRTGLGPIVANLNQLSSEHRVMAHALDTTRHQIPTRGIHLPTDHEGFQASLVSALNESEKLLGQLSIITRQDTPKVAEYSRAIEMLEKAVDKECKVLWDCQELLAAAESLTTAETSLKIQNIEASPVDV